MDYTTIESEFMRPLVNGWLNKIESATTSKDRKQWKETADECMMFYTQSANAMWSPQYSKKFWKGVKLPKFRITINKAFEMVAIFGPNLFWEVPHRQVKPKRALEIPPEMFGQDEQAQMMYQQIQMQMQQEEQRDEVITHLMDRWLNYTPREQPGGGLAGHSQRCVIDALIKGRGVLAPRPYKMPGSGRNLTGAFRVAPEDIFLDPDFDSPDECRWMAIRHIDVHTEVEDKFGLPKGSLKNRTTLESSWLYSESSTDNQTAAHRKDGATNDLVVWYEIFSKSGLGVMNTSMDSTIRDHFDEVVGQYAYVAVTAGLPHPLNMASESLRKGSTDDEVAQAFSWPIPYWSDDRWPVEFLDFYHSPDSAWPVAPLAPGLGELKLLNFLTSWFASRTWSSSRDFWAVAQPHLEHYKDYLMNGEDQSIIPTPPGMTPKEAIEIITQPESRQDMTQLIGFVSDMFDKRVGLTPTIYGQNENQTQNRTAEETMSKQRAVMARPEHMQKQVVDWQSRVAQAEAFVARWFVTPEDIASFMGPAGAMLWQQHVMSTDIELVVRQFQYTIGAASIRRPNRERDIGNYQQVMGQFAPVLAAYGQESGNYGPWNSMVDGWGELHDADMEDMLIPPPDEEKQAKQAQFEEAAQQLELQTGQAEVAKTGAETQKIQADAQTIPMQMQHDQMKAQLDAQSQQMKAQLDAQSQQAKMVMDMQAAELKLAGEQISQQMDMQAASAEQQSKQFESTMELVRDMQRHDQEMEQDQEVHEQELEQKKEMAEVDQKVKKEQADAAVKATKAQAAAQPKAEPKKPAAKKPAAKKPARKKKDG